MIRKLLPEDRPALLKILNNTVQFCKEEVSVALELIDIAINNPGQGDYYIFVYESGNSVLGYYCAGRRPLTDGVFDLYWIAVAAEEQSKGIGKALILHAEDFVESLNARWLLIETSSRQDYCDTRNFYLHNGYYEVSKIHDFYSAGDALIIYGKFFQQSRG